MNRINKMQYQQDDGQPASRTKMPLSSQYILHHQGHSRKLNNSNSSHLGRRSHLKNMQQQSGHQIAVVNESMIQLQDPNFIASEIDDFQARLNGNTSRGFCKVTRDKSLLLSNTQGYRKFKQQYKQTQSKQRTNLGSKHPSLPQLINQQQQTNLSKQIPKQQQRQKLQQTNQVDKQELKQQLKSSSSSLCYSKDSAVVPKKLSQKSFVFQDNSKISNDSELPSQPDSSIQQYKTSDDNSKRINNVKSL